MSENKFIQHLKGESTVGSLVEVKNQSTPASFGNMPQGTSEPQVKYADVRGDVTVVANGTMNWKINNSNLVPASVVSGDGQDFTSTYSVSGAGLWVNATYTFPSTGDVNHPIAMIFNQNSKWVLKFCGDNLVVDNGSTVDLTLVITFGTTTIISKQFTVAEQANQFCKELVIDFAESNANMIKAQGLSTMKVQVLCGTANASARIYNGMTVFTVLQRKVDAAVVSNSFANVEEALRDGILPSDYFNNVAYIAQIEDGDTAYAVFTRDGDTVALSGWAQPIPDQTNNAGKFLTTDGSLMSWEELTISNVSGLQDELDGLQDQIDNLSGRGRFLALWNCATGLAESNPPESPYLYKAGDYFIVSVTSSATPAVNYKPDGSSYTTGVASTTVETAEVKVDDVYVYDGTNWKLLASSQRTYTFAGIAGSPYDNTALSNALNSKVDETSTANQVYGTDNNGDQTTYNITDFGAVDDVKVNNVSVVTSKIANIDLTSYLKNIATATDAISVYGTANTTWTNGINIGAGSRINSTNGIAIGVDASADVNAVGIGRDADAGVRGTAIGAYAKTSYDTGIAIGCWNSNTHNAVSSAKGAYQFGVGTNSTARTLNVGWYDDSVSPSTFRNYQLLDGNTGLIPDARISTNIARTADIPTVNDATLTIQKNGTDIDTFTANSATNKTVNIIVPTTPGDIGAQAALTAGTNIQITGTTISATDTTYSNFTGATAGDAGASGLVPAPAAGDQGKFLQGDGTWANPTIPTVNNPTITITQGGVTKGSFTLNQASGDTIALDAGSGSYTAGDCIDITSGVISVDTGNATSTTKEAIVGWGLPDYNNPISIGTFDSSNPYTAPKAGFFYCAKASGITLYVNGAESYYGGTAGGVSSAWGATVFVSKGDIITTDAGSTNRPTFYPLKGVA